MKKIPPVLVMSMVSIFFASPLTVKAMLERKEEETRENNTKGATTRKETKKQQTEDAVKNRERIGSNPDYSSISTQVISSEETKVTSLEDFPYSLQQANLSNFKSKDFLNLSVLEEEKKLTDAMLDSLRDEESVKKFQKQGIISSLRSHWEDKDKEYKDAINQAFKPDSNDSYQTQFSENFPDEFYGKLEKLEEDAWTIVTLLRNLEQQEVNARTSRVNEKELTYKKESSFLIQQQNPFSSGGIPHSLRADTYKNGAEHWNPSYPILHDGLEYYTTKETPSDFFSRIFRPLNRTPQEREHHRQAIHKTVQELPEKDRPDFLKRFRMREVLGQPLTSGAISEWEAERERNVESGFFKGLVADGVRGASKIFSVVPQRKNGYTTIPETFSSENVTYSLNSRDYPPSIIEGILPLFPAKNYSSSLNSMRKMQVGKKESFLSGWFSFSSKNLPSRGKEGYVELRDQDGPVDKPLNNASFSLIIDDEEKENN